MAAVVAVVALAVLVAVAGVEGPPSRCRSRCLVIVAVVSTFQSWQGTFFRILVDEPLLGSSADASTVAVDTVQSLALL